MAWKRIPIEVQELIIRQLPNKADVARIRTVSKHFQDTALRFLYRTVEIEAKDEWQLLDLNLAPLLRTLYEHPEYVEYIKNVCISAPIHRNVNYRCPHLYERGSKYTEAYQEAYEEGFEEIYDQECEDKDWENTEPSQEVTLSGLGSSVRALLHRLRDNSLRSFSWELGTCVPSELLGTSGDLPTKQNQIESLSLLTDSWCQLNNGTKQTNRAIPTLDYFTSLRSISWRGIHLRSDFLALRGAIQTNSKHLKTLELDLIQWSSAEHYYNFKGWNQDKTRHFLAYEILQLGTRGREVTFPLLETLSLSGVSYHTAASEFASAFNFSKLRSLKLNNCPHIQNFLKAIVEAGQPIRLTLLELVMDSDILRPADPMIKFLESFRGLKAFYLLTHNNRSSRRLWNTILLHHPTLKQLVYHERPYKDERTIDNLIFPWTRTSWDTVPSLGLTYVGLCCPISQLESNLGALATDSLELLHIRRTELDKHERHTNYAGSSTSSKNFYRERIIESRELHNFAKWAFGPHGLPRLQVLAYGDFSYGNRYAQQNTLLRRKLNSVTTNRHIHAEMLSFEVIKTDNWKRMYDMDVYLEVLEACPAGYLYS